MSTSDILESLIEKDNGYSVSYTHLKDAVIGDVVRARAMKMKKNYGFARLMEILTSSEARVEPDVYKRQYVV